MLDDTLTMRPFDLYALAHARVHEAATSHWSGLPAPTKAQKQANAYKLAPAEWQGLAIKIENPAHTLREGVGPSGKAWRTIVQASYGFIDGTKGADGDEIDVFLGPFPESDLAWIINQTNPNGSFDETKVMAGFVDRQQALDAYRFSYSPGWSNFRPPIPVSLAQLKWWMKFADTTREFALDLVPSEPSMTDNKPPMARVFWDSTANPAPGTTLAAVLYEIRRHDGTEGLIFDSMTMADITEGCERVMLDALVTLAGRLKPTMAALMRVMVAAGQDVKPVEFQLSDPIKRFGSVQVAAIFELSDGQTITAWFHNPDTTPGKFSPADELVSWKWQLNKKDVTIAVAPESGSDLNIREVARRLMRLAEKNSAAFVKANAKRAGTMEAIAGLRATLTERQGTLKRLIASIEVAKVERTDRAPKAWNDRKLDPTTPAGYAIVRAAGEAALRMWQDKLDSLFTSRIYAVKDALVAAGWEAHSFYPNSLSKRVDGELFEAGLMVEQIGAGKNAVGLSIKVKTGAYFKGEVSDDLTQTPEQMAAAADALAAVNPAHKYEAVRDGDHWRIVGAKTGNSMGSPRYPDYQEALAAIDVWVAGGEFPAPSDADADATATAEQEVEAVVSQPAPAAGLIQSGAIGDSGSDVWQMTREQYFNDPARVRRDVTGSTEAGSSGWNIRYAYDNPGGAGPFKGSASVQSKMSKGDSFSAPFGMATVTSASRGKADGADDDIDLLALGKAFHRQAVVAALAAGKSVSVDVLADYPDLISAQSGAQPAPAAAEDASVPDDFEEAKAKSDRLYQAMQAASAGLEPFPKGPMGLTPDDVKATPEFQAAKAAYNMAFDTMRAFYVVYTKKFKAELAAEQSAKYGGPMAWRKVSAKDYRITALSGSEWTVAKMGSKWQTEAGQSFAGLADAQRAVEDSIAAQARTAADETSSRATATAPAGEPAAAPEVYAFASASDEARSLLAIGAANKSAHSTYSVAVSVEKSAHDAGLEVHWEAVSALPVFDAVKGEGDDAEKPAAKTDEPDDDEGEDFDAEAEFKETPDGEADEAKPEAKSEAKPDDKKAEPEAEEKPADDGEKAAPEKDEKAPEADDSKAEDKPEADKPADDKPADDQAEKPADDEPKDDKPADREVMDGAAGIALMVLDSEGPGHVFHGNQHVDASHESRGAVHSSMRAKHAEKHGDAKAQKKTHRTAHYAHMAAAENTSGKSKNYHKVMARFHAKRGGLRLDSVEDDLTLDDASGGLFGDGDSGYIKGTLKRNGVELAAVYLREDGMVSFKVNSEVAENSSAGGDVSGLRDKLETGWRDDWHTALGELASATEDIGSGEAEPDPAFSGNGMGAHVLEQSSPHWAGTLNDIAGSTVNIGVMLKEGGSFPVKLVRKNTNRAAWYFEVYSAGKKADSIPFPAIRGTMTLGAAAGDFIGYVNTDAETAADIAPPGYVAPKAEAPAAAGFDFKALTAILTATGWQAEGDGGNWMKGDWYVYANDSRDNLSIDTKETSPATTVGHVDLGGKSASDAATEVLATIADEEAQGGYAKTPEEYKQVAMTILQQLGGRKFALMTGAKDAMTISEGNGGLRFNLPTGFSQIDGKSTGINRVFIRLNSSDTYDIEFGGARGKSYTVRKTADDIYADGLQEVFTRYTGLDTSMGRKSAAAASKATGSEADAGFEQTIAKLVSLGWTAGPYEGTASRMFDYIGPAGTMVTPRGERRVIASLKGDTIAVMLGDDTIASAAVKFNTEDAVSAAESLNRDVEAWAAGMQANNPGAPANEPNQPAPDAAPAAPAATEAATPAVDPAGTGAAVAGIAEPGPAGAGVGAAAEASGVNAATALLDKLAKGYSYPGGIDTMPEGLGKTARKLGAAILARDAAAMADILNPSNKRSRDAFEGLFDGKLKLPSTIKGTRAVIDDFLSKVSGAMEAEPAAADPAAEKRAADVAMLNQVIAGTHPDMLEPELLDEILAVMDAYPSDEAMQVLATKAINACSNGGLNATAPA